MTEDIGIVIPLLAHHLQIFGEQVIDPPPLLMGEDGLLYPQSKILVAPEIGGVGGRTGNDSLELLE